MAADAAPGRGWRSSYPCRRPAERAVLGHILSADFVGAAALRSQLDRTEVVATWGVGSVSVDLRVRGLVQDPAPASTVLPVDARVHDRSGEYIGELLVWAEGGTTLWSVETVVVGCCCSAFSSMAGRAGPAPAPPGPKPGAPTH